MTSVVGLLLAIVCIGIVATGVGIVLASWCAPELYAGRRVARGVVVTVGFAFVLIAAFHPIAQAR
jgi:hypothetical protein